MSVRLSDDDFMPADSLADNEIDFFSLNVPRPGGQHVGMYFAPIVAVHRATGVSVTVSDVERSQFATKEKAKQRLTAVLDAIRSTPLRLARDEREALEWAAMIMKGMRAENWRETD
jgi:protein subunit release factor A